MTTSTQHESSALAETIYGASVTGRAWTPDAAYRYCERLARSHYENFPVGSIMIPKALRKHFYSIYAFARIADDFADERYNEGHSQQERLDLLQQWRDMLDQSARGRARHPVFIALARTRAQFDLPLSLFEDLISAFAQDVTTRRYQSFEQLLDYCRRSAHPIGRLILLLFGHREEEMHRLSDCICAALQLANHWQDIDIDLGKDRIYVPAEDLSRFGLNVEAIKQRSASERFKRLMKFEVARARELFIEGKPLCIAVSGRLGLELRAVWLAGWSILNRIEENDYDIFSRRPAFNSADKIHILLSAMKKGAFRRIRW